MGIEWEEEWEEDTPNMSELIRLLGNWRNKHEYNMTCYAWSTRIVREKKMLPFNVYGSLVLTLNWPDACDTTTIWE